MELLTPILETNGSRSLTLTGPGNTVVDTETVTVTGNGTYSTPTGYTLPDSGTVTGTYTSLATYAGDANNNSAIDSGANEQTMVSSASPTLVTTARPGAVTLPAFGTILGDAAVL